MTGSQEEQGTQYFATPADAAAIAAYESLEGAMQASSCSREIALQTYKLCEWWDAFWYYFALHVGIQTHHSV